MLRGIHIVDFCNHRDTLLRFGKLTAFVGQNGAGKTNALHAIEAVYGSLDRRPRDRWNRQGSNGKGYAIGAAWGLADQGPSSAVMVTPSMDLTPPLISRNDPTWIPDASRVTPDAWDRCTILAGAHPSDWRCRYARLESSKLRSPSYSELVPPMLEADGSGLAWRLSYLMTAERERIDELTADLREIVPLFRGLRSRPTPITKIRKRTVTVDDQKSSIETSALVMGQELLFDMASGRGMNASAVSDGTLCALAILTFIEQSSGPLTLLLDDIEQGLHPFAQRSLIRKIKQMTEARDDLQIIFTSHSPYVIDELEAKDVWLFASDAEGIARAVALADHPDAERARGVLTTGEFWSAEGEEWVLAVK